MEQLDRDTKTLSMQADDLEARLARELENLIPVKSALFLSGERDPRLGPLVKSRDPNNKGKTMLMGPDPRLPRMPDKPTLVDFFRLRFAPTHLLQSARLARLAGLEERIVLACLLHDIAVAGLVQGDHGYWGAQLIEPYVDQEISWAVRAHQALRFYADPAFGYEYPEVYVRNFGAEYKPDPHIRRAYEQARKHKWYATARMITVYDIYSFDPNVTVDIDDFADIIEKHFRQPEEGLGFDDSPSAHMWRTINMPTRML
jgi:predicted HD phosphohydrolase